MQRTGPAHVASLVANAPLESVLAAAAETLASECGAARALISRRDPQGFVALWGESAPPAGASVIDQAVDGGGSVRHDAPGASAAAAPIVVGGVPWGAISVHATTTLPATTEARAEELAALVAAAVALAALAASRERILAATDEARRRFERELHDGAQQRLVTLAMELQLAEPELPGPARPRLARAVEHAEEILEQLRALSRGLHPAILTEGGLRPALRALARRSAVPVRLASEVDERFEDRVEVAAYHVVSEAVANAAAHAGASRVDVRVALNDGRLRIAVTDDGRGGADPARGSGLTALSDRVEALGGALAVVSAAGGGTTVSAELPPRPR